MGESVYVKAMSAVPQKSSVTLLAIMARSLTAYGTAAFVKPPFLVSRYGTDFSPSARRFTRLNGNLQQRKTRPLCAAFDADSGGDLADIPALVSILALVGSMIIIEDKAVSKPGQKVNSLEDTSDLQGQADMYEFSNIIRGFRFASINKDMMITARIESFTVRKAAKDEAKERASI